MVVGILFLIPFIIWLVRRWKRKRRESSISGSSGKSDLPPHDKQRIKEEVLRAHQIEKARGRAVSYTGEV
jgi:hypothetical protein